MVIKPQFLMNSRHRARITQRVNKDFEKIRPERVITTRLGAFLRVSRYWRSDILEKIYRKHYGKLALIIPQWMGEKGFWKRIREKLTGLLTYVHDAGPGRPLFWTERRVKVLRLWFQSFNWRGVSMKIFETWGHRVSIKGKGNCFDPRWWKQRGIPPPIRF